MTSDPGYVGFNELQKSEQVFEQSSRRGLIEFEMFDPIIRVFDQFGFPPAPLFFELDDKICFITF